MDNHKAIIRIGRNNTMKDERIIKIVRVHKRVNEVINESTIKLYGHIRRMKENKIMKIRIG